MIWELETLAVSFPMTDCYSPHWQILVPCLFWQNVFSFSLPPRSHPNSTQHSVVISFKEESAFLSRGLRPLILSYLIMKNRFTVTCMKSFFFFFTSLQHGLSKLVNTTFLIGKVCQEDSWTQPCSAIQNITGMRKLLYWICSLSGIIMMKQ